MARALVKRNYGSMFGTGQLLRMGGALARRGAGALAGRAAKYVQQQYKRRRTGGAVEPSVITAQHDVSNRYRRRAMPGYRRRKWVRFTKRVNHVMMQQTPLTTYTTDNAGAIRTVALDTQVTDGHILGGVSITGNRELLDIFQAAYGSGLGISSLGPYKLFVKSMCLDVQISNTGVNGLIVDVYTVAARKNDELARTLRDQYNADFAQQLTTGIGAVDGTNPATTPFQNAPFTRMWKVLEKKQIILATGQVTTLQIRLPHNRMISGKALQNNEAQLPGISRGFLFQVRGVPGKNASLPALLSGEFTWKAQTTIAYSLPPSARTTDGTAQL